MAFIWKVFYQLNVILLEREKKKKKTLDDIFPRGYATFYTIVSNMV